MVRRLVSDGRGPSGPCTEPASARTPETRREGRRHGGKDGAAARGPGLQVRGPEVAVLEACRSESLRFLGLKGSPLRFLRTPLVPPPRTCFKQAPPPREPSPD